jgi:IclR family pca regulon transcriptional regulator
MGENTAMRDNDYINSVARALKILEIFGEASRPLTLTEVANRAQLTKTTTQRFLHTLACLGYLNREEHKRYFLGTKILSLGLHFLHSSSLRTLVKPYLDELSSELELTVNLAVLDHCDVLVLYRKQVKKFLNFDIHPGSKLFAYGSALGVVLLAGLSDQDLETRLNAMEIHPITPKTIVSKAAIMARIVQTRGDGYAISDQEQSMDLCSIGVPLINEQRQTAAAINVSLGAMERSNQDLVEAALRQLIAKGKLISRLLGYDGAYPKIFVEQAE